MRKLEQIENGKFNIKYRFFLGSRVAIESILSENYN